MFCFVVFVIVVNVDVVFLEYTEVSVRSVLPNCFQTSPLVKHAGGAVAQSVERSTPGEEVPGSIPPVAARSLLVGSVAV